jgi:hypothetical protein
MSVDVGPALGELLRSQQEEEDALAYPRLKGYAAALGELSRRLGLPMVWPVGVAAERLAGAAVIESAGGIRIRGWNDDLCGDRVLLLGGVAVSPLGLYAAAEQAKCFGVREVMATGIRVDGIDASGSIDAFFPLDKTPSSQATNCVRQLPVLSPQTALELTAAGAAHSLGSFLDRP